MEFKKIIEMYRRVKGKNYSYTSWNYIKIIKCL